MTPLWLIVADDLTGAADCAIAFARHGLTASVSWGGDAPSDAVVAIDADSRRMTAAGEAFAYPFRIYGEHDHIGHALGAKGGH